MKIFLIAILILFALYLGYHCSKKYRKRQQFFQAMVMLCQKFDVEINYSKERVKNIILSLDDKQKNMLQGIDKNYISFLNQETNLTKEALFQGISFIKEEEKDILFMFFKSLGRSDLEGQSKEIKNFIQRFDNLCKAAETDNKKYGSLSIKLGIIASLFVLILFI